MGCSAEASVAWGVNIDGDDESSQFDYEDLEGACADAEGIGYTSYGNGMVGMPCHALVVSRSYFSSEWVEEIDALHTYAPTEVEIEALNKALDALGFEGDRTPKLLLFAYYGYGGAMTQVIPAGTRVRVTFEGTVDGSLTRAGHHRVTIPGLDRHFHAIYPTDTVEILPPPAPEFEDGEFYRLGMCVYQYSNHEGGFFIGAGPGQYDTQRLSDDDKRRLVKLVPEETE